MHSKINYQIKQHIQYILVFTLNTNSANKLYQQLQQSNVNTHYYFIHLILMSLEQRKQTIDAYLARSEDKQNEIPVLRSKGPDYFIHSLNTDIENGLTVQQVEVNKKKYERNQLSHRKLKTFFQFICAALQDQMLRILIVAAIVSIVVQGIYSEERSTFWIQGVAILCAVVVVTLVASINDYQKQRQFEDLNRLSELSNKYDVVRNNVSIEVARDEIVVGDIMLLKSGIEIPIDGLVVKANDLIVDESSLTGEGQQKYKNCQQKCATKGKQGASPVIISGSKILSGEGRLLVTVVGKYSRMGQLNQLMLNSDQGQEEQLRTPLQQKLDILASKIGYYGLACGGVLFLILSLRLLFANIIPNGWDTKVHLGELIEYLILSVAVIVAAVPQGLPLAVTISLAFSVKKMLLANNLVRRLVSCETMGSAHVICTDKTGTLTQNNMHVVEVWNGMPHQKQKINLSMSASNISDYKNLILSCIANNSAANLLPQPKGSPTEIALLRFAMQINPKQDLLAERKKAQKNYFLRLPFNSDRKRITTGMNVEEKKYIFTSGASELILKACQNRYDVMNGQCSIVKLNHGELFSVVKKMTSKGLRVIALAGKTVPSIDAKASEKKNEIGICDIEKSGFTLMMLAGLQDPPRIESKGAIADCHRAGVVVIMVTGDNTDTAKCIARDLGITNAGLENQGTFMEGAAFETAVKNKSKEEFYQIVKHLKVLSRSRPQHKYTLVKGLQSLNNVVAVTGDGTNDAPALKKADVGLAMGITGTQIAKNAADILLMDDNFNSIITALLWGRNIYDSVRKFLQFQLTVNLVATIVSLLTALLIRQSVLTPVQMLWVNMIMDSFASLALATEDPQREQLLRREPINRSESLISKLMIKHVVGQSIFQISVLLYLLFEGHKFIPQEKDAFDAILGQDLEAKYFGGGNTVANGCFYPIFDTPPYEPIFQKYNVYSRHFTFIFNTFVLLQVINFFNCRLINDQLNLFKNLFLNYVFWVIILITGLLQWVIIYLLPQFFKLYKYNGLTFNQWIFSLAIASLSIIVSLLLRLIPFGKNAPPQSNELATVQRDIKFRQQQRVQINKK